METLDEVNVFWRNQRVLITGATGLVGSWLTRKLMALGAAPVVLIRDADPQSELIRSGDIRGVTVVQGALEDFLALERAVNEHEVETVFHLGAQTIVSTAHRFPLQTFEANIRGTYHLLEACRVHADLVRRVVIASSDKAYGEPTALPYTEESRLDGRHPYDVSKSCADLIAQTYAQTYGLRVAIARCGNVYGGGDLNWSRIVPGTLRALLRGQRPVIRSDGTYLRDYIYVEDVVQAYLRLAEWLEGDGVAGEGFNFSTERPTSVLEIVVALQRLTGREDLMPDVRANVRGEIRDQYLSAAKAHRVLGWKPAYDLEAGLRETTAWYRVFLRDR